LLDPFHGNVSVVVLNYNRAQTTIECLQALGRATTPLLREIIVVDNGSRQEELDVLRAVVEHPARLVEVGCNRYFGEGNNIGAEQATGDYLVFLNNDAFVEPGWLDEMAWAMATDPEVAAVGAMLLYPDGRVQEVGGLVLPTGNAAQIGKGAVWGPEHYTEIYPVDYCSASCLLLRRNDFLSVGGFSYEYEPAYYEDTDLCLKMWANVGKVVVNPRARVVHLESHTTADRSLELDGIVELNREKFLGQWGEWLATRPLRGTVLDQGPAAPALGPTERFPTVFPEAGRLQAVVYSPYEVVPGGGERYVFELLDHMSSTLGQGRVALATPHRYSSIRIAQIGGVFGFDEPVAVPVTFDSIADVPVEIAIVVGNSIVPPVRGFGRYNIYHCQFPFVAPDFYIEERRDWLDDYAEIWVNSTFTRRYTQGMAHYHGLRCPPVRVINPPSTWPGAHAGRPWAERHTILSVGRFFTEGHDKRQDVVIDVVRGLSERGWAVDLALAGSLHTTSESRGRYAELAQRASGLNCRFYPNASRQQVEQLYANSAVLVHAAGFGLDPLEFPERLEHFGIAPVEAASMGCIPVVYGEGGPAEVMALLRADTVFHSRDECTDMIAALLSDPVGSAELSEELRERAGQFSPEAFRKRVSGAFEEIGAPGAW
jgi:O-antigen biosynthesis protein